MDRRTTLSKMFGRKNSETTTLTAPPVVVSGLAPYTGPFGFEQAAHLLRRTTFGATYQQVKKAVTDGIDTTFTNLFISPTISEEPLNPNFTDDPCTPIGQTWVKSKYLPSVPGMRASREQSLYAWTLNRIRTEEVSLIEKMVLFWHNHFPVANINETRSVYQYSQLIRANAVGNFRELTKEMVIDTAMLVYLNGNTNTANSPNENFARELLELFTIGKGPLAGPSDYTNYTEQDVVEMAKVLSGWRVKTNSTANPNNTDCPFETPGPEFLLNRHNQTTKQLSYRFNDVQIPNMGNQEYAHLIDIIFSKDECARFICRKLYLWFVYYNITQQVEDEVIAPMAQILVANDYEIQPALEALLRSEHFFDMLNYGPMIKNPIDFTLGVFKVFDVDFSTANITQRYRVLWSVYNTATNAMQMPYYDPPSVAGWKAYYQEPGYYRIWINSVTLPIREAFVKKMLTNNGFSNTYTDDQGNSNTFKATIDVLKFAASIDDPTEPNNLIDEFVKILFPQPITQSQHDYLKSILLPGLPDSEWTVEYGDYLNAPNNTALKNAIISKLRKLLGAMMTMPEFYLS